MLVFVYNCRYTIWGCIATAVSVIDRFRSVVGAQGAKLDGDARVSLCFFPSKVAHALAKEANKSHLFVKICQNF